MTRFRLGPLQDLAMIGDGKTGIRILMPSFVFGMQVPLFFYLTTSLLFSF
jgi:hypothetical protein